MTKCELKKELDRLKTMAMCSAGMPTDVPDPVFALSVLYQALRANYKDLWRASKAWIDWMDSPGDGTNKTLKDEERMLNAIRKALKRCPEGILTSNRDRRTMNSRSAH